MSTLIRYSGNDLRMTTTDSRFCHDRICIHVAVTILLLVELFVAMIPAIKAQPSAKGLAPLNMFV